MMQCAYCGTDIPEGARFCGSCGRVPDMPPDGQTRISNRALLERNTYSTHAPAAITQPGSASSPGMSSLAQWKTAQGQTPPVFLQPQQPVTQSDEEEEEERKRRAALLGFGLAMPGSMPGAGNAPMVQGTPQLGGVPSLPGAPNLPGGASLGATNVMPPSAPPSSPWLPPGTPTPLPPHPSQPAPPGTPGHTPHPGTGCAPAAIIAAILIPVLIILSIIGLGLTVLSPALSLNGSDSVAMGGTLTVFGNHFVPGSTVALTFDGSIPLYVNNGDATPHLARYAPDHSALFAAYQPMSASNTIVVSGGGTFSVHVAVENSWTIGQHTITASETLTRRSATLTFTVLAPGTTPTIGVSPSPTQTTPITPTAPPSVTPSPTITPTGPTPTGTTITTGLSCINPASVALGPVIQNSTQIVSSVVTLCAAGVGSVSWSASWNTTSAFWLSLAQTSGTINAPGQAQIKVSANASQLSPGSYSATVVFVGQPNNTTESLTVNLSVQTGCIKGSTSNLRFTGVALVNDPAMQSITLTNCGPTGTWSASAQTTDGANWLYVNPSSSALNAGATTPVSISVSNLKTRLAAGSYTGSVTFTLGTGSFVVNVSLTVLPTPTLSVAQRVLYGSQDCKNNSVNYICFVTITNTSSSASLPWSVLATNIPGVTFIPDGGTLSPGQQLSVEVDIPVNDCASGATLTFSGPANSATVYWNCYLIG